MSTTSIYKLMSAWAIVTAANNNFHYVTWNSKNTATHECPICKNHKVGAEYGWNAIGFAFAAWHHGGGLSSKCNCGVVPDSIIEKILKATDKDALALAQKYIGIKNVKVVRNSKKAIPLSKLQEGDILLLFHDDKYYHAIYYMGNGKYADSTRIRDDNVKADVTMSSATEANIKVAFRYTGNTSVNLKSSATIAQEVLDDKWGDGDTRKKALTRAGYNYDTIQKKINELLHPPVKKSYPGTYPTLAIKKSNAQVIADAIVWGKWIARDNSFHYGYTNKSRTIDAHHNGCYFCGTNVTHGGRSKKGIVDYKKTYCCNPFVGAAWAHGGGDSVALKLCQNGTSWDFHVGRGYDTSNKFKKMGHPAKSKLKAGDVLCNSSHVALYIGDGQLVEAASGDDNVRNSAKWNNSIRITNLTTARYRSFTRVYRYVGSVNVASRSIRYGEVSYRVKHLQQYLNWYFGKQIFKCDGIFGDVTLKYVKAFQIARKLNGDGVVGEYTIKEMKKVKK